jgi:hypothetical protein
MRSEKLIGPSTQRRGGGASLRPAVRRGLGAPPGSPMLESSTTARAALVNFSNEVATHPPTSHLADARPLPISPALTSSDDAFAPPTYGANSRRCPPFSRKIKRSLNGRFYSLHTS